MNLALLQARTGNADSAKQSLDIALSLSATDAERARRRREFAATIKVSPTGTAQPQP
jgi:hypothetical protein